MPHKPKKKYFKIVENKVISFWTTRDELKDGEFKTEVEAVKNIKLDNSKKKTVEVAVKKIAKPKKKTVKATVKKTAKPAKKKTVKATVEKISKVTDKKPKKKYFKVVNGKVKSFWTTRTDLKENEYTSKKEADKNILQMNSFRFIITDQNCNIFYGAKSYSINRSDARYDVLKKAIHDEDPIEIYNLLNPLKTFHKGIEKSENKIKIYGKEIPKEFGEKITELSKQGKDGRKIFQKFWDNLLKNPDDRIKDQLFAFLNNHGHYFTTTGKFLAYKGVKSDLYDSYSGKFLNKPGSIISMPRDQVDSNPNRTCSSGLHVGSWEYVSRSYSTYIEVEVDPKDVVSVPIDYNSQKMRTCKYKVLRVITAPRNSKCIAVEPKVMK